MVAKFAASFLVLAAASSLTACSSMKLREDRRIASAAESLPEAVALECHPVISEHGRMAGMNLVLEVNRDSGQVHGLMSHLRLIDRAKAASLRRRESPIAGELSRSAQGGGLEATLTLTADSPIHLIALTTNYPGISTVSLKNGQDYLMTCVERR